MGAGGAVGDGAGGAGVGAGEATAVDALAAGVAGTAVGLTATPVAVGFATAVEETGVLVGAATAVVGPATLAPNDAVGVAASAPSPFVGAGGPAGPLPGLDPTHCGLAAGSLIAPGEGIAGFGLWLAHAATSRPAAQHSATASTAFPDGPDRRRIIEAPHPQSTGGSEKARKPLVSTAYSTSREGGRRVDFIMAVH